MLVRIDQVADVVDEADHRLAADGPHGPFHAVERPRLQILQVGQVVLGHGGQHDQRIDLGDLDQVRRVVNDRFVQGHVLLDDHAVVGARSSTRAHCLSRSPALARRSWSLVTFLTSSRTSWISASGTFPGLQGVFGPIDGVKIGLHVALGIQEKDFRHGGGVVARPVLSTSVSKPQLREGVEEVVFLVAQIDAVEHRQQVAFADRVARPASRGAQGRYLPGDTWGSSVLPISTTSAGAKRTRTRIKRAGSMAVEPGITSGSFRTGTSATAICSRLPFCMPNAQADFYRHAKTVGHVLH